MSYSEIISCLEQKVILMTKILDITKQIEVRCKQTKITLDDFLDKRRDYMHRVDKCNHLISTLSAELAEEEQKRLKKLMSGTESLQDKTEEETQIEELAAKSRMIVQRAASLDRDANELLKKRYNEVREKINESRKKGVNLMFYKNK